MTADEDMRRRLFGLTVGVLLLGEAYGLWRPQALGGLPQPDLGPFSHYRLVIALLIAGVGAVVLLAALVRETAAATPAARRAGSSPLVLELSPPEPARMQFALRTPPKPMANPPPPEAQAEAPRPPASTPAPARFLPDFDNLMLAHADRSRLIADEHRRHLTTKNLRVNATALFDGEACATWAIKRRAKSATLELTPFAPLAKPALRSLEAEGLALLADSEPGIATLAVSFNQPHA